MAIVKQKIVGSEKSKQKIKSTGVQAPRKVARKTTPAFKMVKKPTLEINGYVWVIHKSIS